jgi:hypothetical protein
MVPLVRIDTSQNNKQAVHETHMVQQQQQNKLRSGLA